MEENITIDNFTLLPDNNLEVYSLGQLNNFIQNRVISTYRLRGLASRHFFHSQNGRIRKINYVRELTN